MPFFPYLIPSISLIFHTYIFLWVLCLHTFSPLFYITNPHTYIYSHSIINLRALLIYSLLYHINNLLYYLFIFVYIFFQSLYNLLISYYKPFPLSLFNIYNVWHFKCKSIYHLLLYLFLNLLSVSMGYSLSTYRHQPCKKRLHSSFHASWQNLYYPTLASTSCCRSQYQAQNVWMG